MYDWAEFRHFRYLLVILEKQGFRPAAEELHSSQPNLTVQARQFQENASLRLFRKARSGRIRPTEHGRAHIAVGRGCLGTRNQGVEDIRAIEQGSIRSVRFGCSPWVDQDMFRTLCALHKEILPACPILPTHDDTAQLAEEVLAGQIDAAIVTLPFAHPELHVEEIRRDRLVVCLRKDDPMARKSMVRIPDLQGRLSVLYHPRRHPDAHERLLELFEEEGLGVTEYSRASNPSEVQMLVKDGHGLALVREGSVLDPKLTTRAIAGIDWTIDTAVVYRKDQHPKTLPIVVKNLKRHCKLGMEEADPASPSKPIHNVIEVPKRPSQSVKATPIAGVRSQKR
jgi:DNA-binding transcriptional LysR family regulator